MWSHRKELKGIEVKKEKPGLPHCTIKKLNLTVITEGTSLWKNHCFLSWDSWFIYGKNCRVQRFCWEGGNCFCMNCWLSSFKCNKSIFLPLQKEDFLGFLPRRDKVSWIKYTLNCIRWNLTNNFLDKWVCVSVRLIVQPLRFV